MSSFQWPPIGGGGVPVYSTFSAFPSGSAAGDLAVAADTGFLYEWTGSVWQLIASPGGALTLGNLDAQAGTAQGAALTGGVLSMQSASATVPGLVNNTTQSLSGQKTFTTGLTGTLTGAASLNVLTSALGNLTDAGTDGITVTGGTGAVVGTVSLSQHVADTTHNGYLSSTDWNTFNSKQPALTLTNLTDIGTDGITITNGTGAVIGASPVTISQHVADTTHSGYLSSTDWNTFNGKQAAGNYITALTGDVTASGPGSVAATVAKIQGTTVSGTTGTTNVVFSSAPTLSNPVVGTQSQGDNSTKAASTAYTDLAVANAIAGINPAVAVQAATTAAGDTSGFTYNNGASGIGATFTGSTNTAITIDGYTFTALGQRLLVKNDTQSPSGAFNGVYYVTQVQTGILPPILTRALDYDTPSDMNNTGAIPVINGTVNGTTQWVLTSQVVTVGTTPLTFAKFSGNPSTYLLAANNLSDVASKTTSFNNLSPMTTGGDIIYGGASGAGTRLANGSAGQVLTSAGTTLPPTWQTPAASSSNNSYLLQNLGLSVSVGSNAMTIALKQEDGSTDPTGGSPAVIGFRSSTATSGGYSTVNSTAATSIVIPSGATLGQISAVNQYVWVYALNNAGTVELAVSGVSVFGNNTIQNTTAITSGSTSGTVLYSTTARTGVAIRLIGRLLVNESTAGTWASNTTDVNINPMVVPTITDPVAYSPTITGFGTATSINAAQSRNGKFLTVTGFFGSGSSTASLASISLPSGVAVDTTIITIGNTSSNPGQVIGTWGTNASVAPTTSNILTATATSTTVVYLGATSENSNNLNPANGNTLASSGNTIAFQFSLPVLGWSTYGP